MKNVMKGFQVSKMALPKFHAVKMNKEFKAYHATSVAKPPKEGAAKKASRLPSKKSWNTL